MSVEMKIAPESCSKCGLCANVCPARAIETKENQLPTRNPVAAKLCINCGQCMAVCPSDSIIIGELSYEKDFLELSKGSLDYQVFYDFVASRRSVRSFQEKAVPRELLTKIVEFVAQAPMAFPPHKTAITIVENRSTIEQMLPLTLMFYEDLLKWMRNPLIRLLVKQDVGFENLATVQNYILPIMRERVPAMKKSGSDQITWGAPVLMLFHASRRSENHTQDANIALSYAMLAAHSLGLGATPIGLVPTPINKVPALRSVLRIPEDHEVVASLIVGYPSYSYQKGIKRELAGVSWV